MPHGPAAVVSLSELDRRIVGLVSDQRVVTSTQLELLLADVPGRTLRYRTDHLHRAGLLGRSRPYRERGSAPYHLWPSRRADTLARGAPAPRGGERAEPNPLFLAHAAGVTELYALLATRTPGLRLARFEREPREQFTAEGRSRTLAPDALVELHDGQGLGLLAFVELDLGTMSHARSEGQGGRLRRLCRAGRLDRALRLLPLPAVHHDNGGAGHRVPEDARRAATEGRTRWLLRQPCRERLLVRGRRVRDGTRITPGTQRAVLGRSDAIGRRAVPARLPACRPRPLRHRTSRARRRTARERGRTGAAAL